MSKIIAFSGGCFSGKTTTIGKVKTYLEERGYNVVVLGELIRTTTAKTATSIDEIRKDPASYLQLQKTVITGKIEQELNAFDDKSDTIYLADRAITDSLFYLQNYVDKSRLCESEMAMFCELHKKVVKHAEKMFSHGYSFIVTFRPIQNGSTDDPYRPSYLRLTNEYEYDAIRILNASFYKSCGSQAKFALVNVLGNHSVDQLQRSILRFIELEYIENYGS